MSSSSNTQQSVHILGDTAHEFVSGVKHGHVAAKQTQVIIIGGFKLTKIIGQLVYWSIKLVLLGIVGWGVFFIRHQVGLIASIMFLMLGFLTLALIGPSVASMQAGIVMMAWVLFMLTFGAIQVVWGVYRLFAPPPMHDHVHRFSAGDSNAVVVFLWNLLPEWIRSSSLARAQELLVLILMSAGLWILDLVVLAEDPRQSSALYMIPLMSASALVLLALIDLVVAAYQGQVFRDQLVDQQDEAQRINSVHGSMHEREAEGFVQAH